MDKEISFEKIKNQQARLHLEDAVGRWAARKGQEKPTREDMEDLVDTCAALFKKYTPLAQKMAIAINLHAANGFNPLHLAEALKDAHETAEEYKPLGNNTSERYDLFRGFVIAAEAAARNCNPANMAVRHAIGAFERTKE